MGALLHPPPFSGTSPGHGATNGPHRAPTSPNLYEGVERPAPPAKQASTSRNTLLLWLFSPLELRKRESGAKRAKTVRVQTNRALGQPMFTDHWLELRPVSLPIYHRTPAPTLLLLRNLPNLGRKRDSSYKARYDPPMRAPFPFPHSPPGSPPPPSPGHPVPDSDEHLAILPEVDPAGPTFSEDGDTDTTSPLAAWAPTPDHLTASTTTAV
jgi:hypothetical protein